MIWVELDDPAILQEMKEKGREVLIQAIRRNKSFADISLADNDLLTLPFVIEPTEEVLRDKLKALYSKGESSIILSFLSPESSYFGKSHPFLHYEARGKYFPFKKAEFDAKIPLERVLEQRMGFKMIEPTYGFESVAGAYNYKKRIRRIKYLMDLGLESVASAMFEFGTAGSGKTYKAQATAKELGCKFGYLDLPHFMSLPSPTKALDELFDFLQDQDSKVMLLIDEIEKMFDFTGEDLRSKNVFGKLLTRLNDIYSDPKNNILFYATANSITGIIKNAPEFLRKGRFNELFFAGYPKEKGAKEIIGLYLRKTQKYVGAILKELYTTHTQEHREGGENQFKGLSELFKEVDKGVLTIDEAIEKLLISLDPEELHELVESAFSTDDKISKNDEFIYSPPEIKSVIEELQYKILYDILTQLDDEVEAKGEIETDFSAKEKLEDMDYMVQHVKHIVPLQIAAKEGITKQLAQSRFFGNTTQGGDKYELYTSVE